MVWVRCRLDHAQSLHNNKPHTRTHITTIFLSAVLLQEMTLTLNAVGQPRNAVTKTVVEKLTEEMFEVNEEFLLLQTCCSRGPRSLAKARLRRCSWDSIWIQVSVTPCNVMQTFGMNISCVARCIIGHIMAVKELKVH